MTANPESLIAVYEGWDGYQRSIVAAVRPLTRQELVWRPATGLRSTGELVRHIALGRIAWFLRMSAPGSRALAAHIDDWTEDSHGNRYIHESAVVAADSAKELVEWLEASWHMIDETLHAWTVEDLAETYLHTWRGDTYAVSRQWTLWRIMAHDVHHGGELALMLGMQGIVTFELGELGGHIVEPPLATPA